MTNFPDICPTSRAARPAPDPHAGPPEHDRGHIGIQRPWPGDQTSLSRGLVSPPVAFTVSSGSTRGRGGGVRGAASFKVGDEYETCDVAHGAWHSAQRDRRPVRSQADFDKFSRAARAGKFLIKFSKIPGRGYATGLAQSQSQEAVGTQGGECSKNLTCTATPQYASSISIFNVHATEAVALKKLYTLQRSFILQFTEAAELCAPGTP